MIRRYTVALMQMDTQNDKGKNLETACAWIDEAAAKGAKLICFPEVMNLIGKNIGEGGGREEIPGYTTERLCAKAKEHGVYIHGGSITQALPGEKRSANTSVLISPEGKILATYSKLHMFDITLADGTITDAAVENGVLQVRNRHEDLTLTLRKELVNSLSTQKFRFTVSYEINGQTVTETLELASGESGTLKIPYGAAVTITETEHDGFAVTFKNSETVLVQGDTCTIKRMTADAAITTVNAAGYALPGTGGGALWLQLAGAALAALAVLAYNWINVKKQKAKGRTRQ